MVTPVEFIEAARTYIGVRWLHLGRTREGVDCVGLLLCAADDCGMKHEMPPPYPRGHRGFDLIEACRRLGQEVPLKQVQDGDILVFADGLFPAHIGIRTTVDGLPYVVHARVNRRKVCEEPISYELADALRRAYRPTVFVNGA